MKYQDHQKQYTELLKDPHWKLKRKEVLIRDNFCCRLCANKNLFNFCVIGYSTLSRMKVASLFKGKQGLQVLSFQNFEFVKVFEISPQSIIHQTPSHYIVYFDGCDDFKSKNTLLAIRELTPEESLHYINKPLNNETLIQRITYHTVYSEFKWVIVNKLEVHHTVYDPNKKLLPWEYPLDTLETLCWICHRDIHGREIDV